MWAEWTNHQQNHCTKVATTCFLYIVNIQKTGKLVNDQVKKMNDYVYLIWQIYTVMCRVNSREWIKHTILHNKRMREVIKTLCVCVADVFICPYSHNVNSFCDGKICIVRHVSEIWLMTQYKYDAVLSFQPHSVFPLGNSQMSTIFCIHIANQTRNIVFWEVNSTPSGEFMQ